LYKLEKVMKERGDPRWRGCGERMRGKVGRE